MVNVVTRLGQEARGGMCRTSLENAVDQEGDWLPRHLDGVIRLGFGSIGLAQGSFRVLGDRA